MWVAWRPARSVQQAAKNRPAQQAEVGRCGLARQGHRPPAPGLHCCPLAPQLTATPSPCRTGSVTRISNSELAGTYRGGVARAAGQVGAGVSRGVGQPWMCSGWRLANLACARAAKQVPRPCRASWLKGRRGVARAACPAPGPGAHPIRPRPRLPARGAGCLLQDSTKLPMLSSWAASRANPSCCIKLAPLELVRHPSAAASHLARPPLPAPLTTVLCSTTLW